MFWAELYCTPSSTVLKYRTDVMYRTDIMFHTDVMYRTDIMFHTDVLYRTVFTVMYFIALY